TRRIRVLQLQTLMSTEAFDSMFEGDDRSREFLKPCDPTDVQSEVLIFDAIEPTFISEVAFRTGEVLDAHRSILRERMASVGPYFSGRHFVRRNDQLGAATE